MSAASPFAAGPRLTLADCELVPGLFMLPKIAGAYSKPALLEAYPPRKWRRPGHSARQLSSWQSLKKKNRQKLIIAYDHCNNNNDAN
jgi:glutathione S-transferase